MSQEEPKSQENDLDQKSLEKLREISATLENSLAVKTLRILQEDNFRNKDAEGKGKGLVYDEKTRGEIFNHPDVKLYFSIKKILEETR